MSDVHPIDPAPLPEGEEQAPPGTQTMALVRWALVAVMALVAVGAWTWWAAQRGSSAPGARWVCPMHPQIVAAQKGECPICGMDLVPAAASGGAPGAAAPAPAVANAARYTCPMHPEFVTTDANARCPECGMKLVPKAPEGAATAPQGVAGLAPVELSQDRIQLAGVKTAAARREKLSGTLHATGFVTATENSLVSVTARFAGWIESVAIAQTGQQVRRGEILATVYHPDVVAAQQAYASAVKWSEKLDTPGGGGTAGADLQRSTRARLELLGLAPQDIDALTIAGRAERPVNVRAPASGYVARRAAVRGLYVSPGTELFQLADLSKVWVLVDVREADLASVGAGQRARFEAVAFPGEAFDGRVRMIYPAVNPATRTLQARVELENPGLKLRPGMYGDVTLDGGAAEAVAVPRDAVVDTGEVQYVFVARGAGRFEPRRVRTGPSRGDRVAILEGLADGERVVTTANFLVDSESRMNAAVREFDAGAAAAHEAREAREP